MTDLELTTAMTEAYHLAWGKADRRRNVTGQVMGAVLALVREHDDIDRGQGEREMARRYTAACETNVKLQAQLSAAHRASSLVDDADAVTAIANMIAAGRNTGKEPRSTAITIAGWLDAVNGRGQR